MAVGSGMRLNGAMSILLMVLLILGGMASMSSLEMGDASAADGNQTDDNSKGDLKEESNTDWLEKCKTRGEKNLDDYRGEWSDYRGEKKFERDVTKTTESSTSARETDRVDNATDDELEEVDWHLPDYITVVRTDFGYVISIDDDGVTITENYTQEEFAEFLERFGWESHTDDDERYREEIREMIGNLREACVNGDNGACRELRGLMERFRDDHAEREGDNREDMMPKIQLEFLDDGTIIANREFSDGNFEYDIISADDKGKLTIVRVSPWGTDVIYPLPPEDYRRGEKGNFEDFSEKMSDEDFRAECKELLWDDGHPPINTINKRGNIERLERSQTE